MHHRAGERQPLLEAQRQGACVDIEMGAEGEVLNHTFQGVAALATAEPVDTGEEFQILSYAQIAVERELLRHVAKSRPSLAWGFGKIEPYDTGCPGRRA